MVVNNRSSDAIIPMHRSSLYESILIKAEQQQESIFLEGNSSMIFGFLHLFNGFNDKEKIRCGLSENYISS